MRGNHSQFGGPAVVSFSLNLPRLHGEVGHDREGDGLFTRPFCTGVAPGNEYRNYRYLRAVMPSKYFVDTNAAVPDILCDLLYGPVCIFR